MVNDLNHLIYHHFGNQEVISICSFLRLHRLCWRKLKIRTDQTLSSLYPSPHTSSALLMLMSETALLELVGPLQTSETVVLSPTLESVTVQIAPPQTFCSTTHDGSRVLQKLPIPEVKLPTHPSDDLAQAPEKFVPSLGLWAKLLFFKPRVTPPKPSTRDYDPTIVGNQLAALWPTLKDKILNKQPKVKYPSRTIQPPIEKLPPQEIKADGSLHFTWTARSCAQSRNLYRADTQTYRLDSTPEISIPFRLSPIIDSCPSTVINTEVRETLVVDPLTTKPITFGFESPSQVKGLGDVEEVVTEASSSINLTKGGRETKLPIKYQEMEWKTI
ncbi:unnamed protein product [Brassica napus]|uniref:(rape) hypothetical protein n=1 Tax=Brassica napus TaxID=3708 RepID=A0A816ZYK7_BRANA|nr:unnamed protein product [Brassica napus]